MKIIKTVIKELFYAYKQFLVKRKYKINIINYFITDKVYKDCICSYKEFIDVFKVDPEFIFNAFHRAKDEKKRSNIHISASFLKMSEVEMLNYINHYYYDIFFSEPKDLEIMRSSYFGFIVTLSEYNKEAFIFFMNESKINFLNRSKNMKMFQ